MGNKENEAAGVDDLDKLLEEKQKLDAMMEEKFSKRLTVMFTDLKGSTAMADTVGDMATMSFLKKHNDILIPAIENNNGVLVKTMGDGSMSYFENPQDGVRAGLQIQKEAHKYNIKNTKTPLLIRIGMHTGKAIMQKNDLFGDVVNTASRFESAANPREIYISEETYNSLPDKDELYCHFIKTVRLKGKKEAYKVFKVFWNKEEIEAHKSFQEQEFDLSQPSTGVYEKASGPGAARRKRAEVKQGIPQKILGIFGKIFGMLFSTTFGLTRKLITIGLSLTIILASLFIAYIFIKGPESADVKSFLPSKGQTMGDYMKGLKKKITNMDISKGKVSDLTKSIKKGVSDLVKDDKKDATKKK